MVDPTPREPSTRRFAFPPAALTPVSPEIARAAAAPFTAGAWLASAVFLLPALVLAGLLGETIRGVEAENRRRVLWMGVLLVQLAASAAVLPVHVRRARDRIDNVDPPLRTLGSAWVGMLGMTASLVLGFLVVWVALRGAADSLSEVAARGAPGGGSWMAIRILQIALGALMAADIAALALLVTWLASIRAIEGCRTGPAAKILRGIWRKARARLLLHAAVAAAAGGAAYAAMNAAVGAIAGQAVPVPPEGSAASILCDQALLMWLVWTPPLAIAGSAGVASYLLLRPLNGPPPA